MGVLLTTGAIVVAVAIGVWSEGRWPAGAARASRSALVLLLYVLLPPVIFFNIAASEIDLGHGVGLVLGIVASSLGAIFAWWGASRFLKLARPQVGAVVCTVLSVNTGYLGYPLAVALLGRDDLPDAVLYDVLVTGPCLLLGAFAVGAAFGTKAGETPRQRAGAFFTRNPPLYAAIAGILAPDALAPDLLVDLSQILIVAILPIGFFAVGATLAENAERGALPMPPPLTRPVMLVIATRLAIVPALLMLLAAPLIDLPPAYGLDMEITAEAVTWSTAIVVLAALGSLLL